MMVMVFVNSQGLIYHEFSTGGSLDYWTTLISFIDALEERHPKKCARHTWALFQDNAPIHNARIVSAYLHQELIQQVPHPPYSPDLNPCDF